MNTHNLMSKESIKYTYDLGYWAKKWKVSVIQISDAIRNTGTTELKKLKSYLSKKGLV